MLVLSAVTHRVFPARARVGLCAGAVSAAGHQPMMNRESRNGRRGRKGECRESRPNREKVSGNPTAGVYGRDGKFLPPLGEFPGGVGARGFNFCRAPASPACDSSLAAPAVSAATTGWSAWNTRASLTPPCPWRPKQHLADHNKALEASPDGQTENLNQYVFSYRGTYLREKLDLVAALSYFGREAEQGSLQRYSATYELAEALDLTGGVVLYTRGDGQNFLLSAAQDNDRVFFEATMMQFIR